MKLDIQNVSKIFDKQSSLTNLNVEVPSFDVLALIGPSGGGKSTLLKFIAGLDFPDQGTILLDDVAVPSEEEKLLVYRRQLGIVFQAWNLFPHLTAIQNITLPLRYVHGYSAGQAEALGHELLKRFSMQPHADKKPFELSGGQCQRVAIIRAVAAHPKLLLLDEPTSALDPLMAAEVFDLIIELKEEGCTLIIATHHLPFAERISDWVIFLSEGKLVASQKSTQLFQKPSSPYIQNYLQKVRLY